MEGQLAYPHMTMMMIFSQFFPMLVQQQTVIRLKFFRTRRDCLQDLFYTSVVIHDAVELHAMLDSGSMACSPSSRLLPKLLPKSL